MPRTARQSSSAGGSSTFGRVRRECPCENCRAQGGLLQNAQTIRRHLEAQNSSQESKFGGPVKGVAINWSRASKLSSPIGNKANSSAPAVGRTNAPRAATKRIKLAGSIGGGGSGGLRPISRRAAPKGPKAGQQVGANETVASKPAGQLPKATSKKIDSQLLKRLLQQTLPKANGTQPATHSGPKGAAGQFKFVFIQRATPAPSPRGSKDLGPVAGANETNDDEPVGERQTKRTDTRPAEPHSLAAAVSQKLAASLLNSAAHLAAHLFNVSSSLATTTSTWLGAAPQASRGLPEEERLKQASAANDKDNDLDSSQSSNFVDIKRKLAVNVTTPQVIKILSAGKQIIAPSQHLAARKSRPSKIYRLPLKFVANGQANGIVLHTIKQHFSMIKRIQAAGAKTSAQDPSGPNRLGQANKLKSNGSKLKGNSRLIYLPLKYLSNARPNMLQVMGTRASHKSAIVSHKH